MLQNDAERTLANSIETQVTKLTPVMVARAAAEARYMAHAQATKEHIDAARNKGCWNAREFAAYMNAIGFPAPNGGPWNLSSVLRVIRALARAGEDGGSLPAHEARKIWHHGRSYKGGAAVTLFNAMTQAAAKPGFVPGTTSSAPAATFNENSEKA